MSVPTVYFITGANRGIGLALVQGLIKKPDVYIYAAARSISPILQGLLSSNPDKASFVSFVAADEASNKEAAKVVAEKFGRVDVVLGVAGISNYLGTVEETPASTFDEHFKVNVTGMLVLFQAFASLLRKSALPKFIPFSSGAGSITAYIDMAAGYTTYGVSKVALNYLSRKIHFENDWLICFPLAPGIVETDMAAGNRALDKTGTLAPLQEALAIAPDVAANLLIGIVETSTRETHGGQFVNVDGSRVPW